MKLRSGNDSFMRLKDKNNVLRVLFCWNLQISMQDLGTVFSRNPICTCHIRLKPGHWKMPTENPGKGFQRNCPELSSAIPWRTSCREAERAGRGHGQHDLIGFFHLWCLWLHNSILIWDQRSWQLHLWLLLKSYWLYLWNRSKNLRGKHHMSIRNWGCVSSLG